MKVYVVYSVDNFEGYGRAIIVKITTDKKKATIALENDRKELNESWDGDFIDEDGNFDNGSDYCEWFIEEHELEG